MFGTHTIHVGDVRTVLPTLEAGSVRCCVTSPPYWGLRDYGTASWEGGDPGCSHVVGGQVEDNKAVGAIVSGVRPGVDASVCRKCGARRIDSQLGLEPTPDEYVANMVAVFREVRRVLADDGTLWLNLGDSYASSPVGSFNGGGFKDSSAKSGGRDLSGVASSGRMNKLAASGLKPKDLVGIPWRVAFALQSDGWVLRQEIVWSKSNPMPESVRDRCTKSHEQIFLFCKSRWSGPKPGRFSDISDSDARVIATAIDTEGNICVKRNRREGQNDHYGVQVAVAGTCLELLESWRNIVGHGSINERPGKNAPVFYWQVTNRIASDLLRRIYPFLVVKRRQAKIGIHLQSMLRMGGPSRGDRDVMESLWERNKMCNKFGNPDLSDVPEPTFGRWSKSERYYFDAEAISQRSAPKTMTHRGGGRMAGKEGNQDALGKVASGNWGACDSVRVGNPTTNRRSVWTITTKPFSEAHFATFPPELPELCIKAGSAPGDTVLDPFNGAGTTGLVACGLGRNYVGIELNPEYAAMAERRIGAGLRPSSFRSDKSDEAPLFSA